MLENWFMPRLQSFSNEDYVWFQQDGALAHFVIAVMECFNEVFPSRWIGPRICQIANCIKLAASKTRLDCMWSYFFLSFHPGSNVHQNIQTKLMQTKGIRLWSKNYTLVSAPSIGRFFCQSRYSSFYLFLFRQLCLYITDSLHLFTSFLTDSLEKCQTKSFENEYSTFCLGDSLTELGVKSTSVLTTMENKRTHWADK